LDATTDVVPVSVPALDETTTVAVDDVTAFPPESMILTTGCVVNATPFTAPLGCVEIVNALAAPILRANEADVTEANEVAVNRSVKFPRVPVSFNPPNVATPLTTVAVNVVDNVPVPEAIATVTIVVESDVTVIPLVSTILITG